MNDKFDNSFLVIESYLWKEVENKIQASIFSSVDGEAFNISYENLLYNRFNKKVRLDVKGIIKNGR